MTISSRTPEGESKRCRVCGKEPIVDPSTYPTRDAPCPHCGSLLLFGSPADASTTTRPSPEIQLSCCPVCGKEPIVNPNVLPCPRCGSVVSLGSAANNSTNSGAAAARESLRPLPPRPNAPAPLQVRELTDSHDIEEIKHLLERLEK
jgi:hypothetical protein